MQEGRWYLVYVHVDHASGRIVASARIDKYLDNVIPAYGKGQEVNLLVADETDIGYKVIINNMHWGLVYRNETFRDLEKGESLKGYIKNVREDDKIDVSLTPPGYRKIEGIAGLILESLKAHSGFLPVHDKSEPEEIYALFACSKKAFKQAIGSLYKEGLITIETSGIRLL
jgi:predicted RNA-binding protein (virulence factor B family)